MTEPGDGYGVRLHVYADKEQFDSRPAGYYGDYVSDDYFKLGEEPKSFTLEEGNYMYLEGTILVSPNAFNVSDYYEYELPEGTYVPAGIYLVGEGDDKDIPPGTFMAYAGTINGGEVKVYNTQEAFEEDGSWHWGADKHYTLKVEKNPVSEMVILEEGNVLLVESDVVMKKGLGGKKLEFD